MSTQILRSAPAGLPVHHGAAGRSAIDPALPVAAALFAAAVIAEAVFDALAAPTIADIGSLIVAVP
jgi:hypothetical protein